MHSCSVLWWLHKGVSEREGGERAKGAFWNRVFRIVPDQLQTYWRSHLHLKGFYWEPRQPDSHLTQLGTPWTSPPFDFL